MRRLQPAWSRQAACRGTGNTAFVPEAQPKGPPPIVTALCPTCPVRAECESHGRATGSSGWWGGLFFVLGFQPGEWKALATWARDLVIEADDNPDRDVRSEIAHGKPVVLNRALVAELRQRYAEGGRTIEQLAEDVAVNANTLSGAIYGSTWKGPRKVLNGERNPNARLTTADVIEIKRRLAAGEMHRTLAAEFGVGKTTITNIASGRRWASV